MRSLLRVLAGVVALVLPGAAAVALVRRRTWMGTLWQKARGICYIKSSPRSSTR